MKPCADAFYIYIKKLNQSSCCMLYLLPSAASKCRDIGEKKYRKLVLYMKCRRKKKERMVNNVSHTRIPVQSLTPFSWVQRTYYLYMYKQNWLLVGWGCLGWLMYMADLCLINVELNDSDKECLLHITKYYLTMQNSKWSNHIISCMHIFILFFL